MWVNGKHSEISLINSETVCINQTTNAVRKSVMWVNGKHSEISLINSETVCINQTTNAVHV